MANQEKSRQQSSYMPSTGAQQGGGEAQATRAARAATQRGTQSLAPRQGAWIGASDYGQGGSPFSLMRRLSEDMDRLFENFGFGGGFAQDRRAAWSPRIEAYEQDGKLVVEAELPGLRKEDVQAQIEDDAIVISGERQSRNEQNEGGRYVSERSYGSFYRVVPLPDNADSGQATASFRDGVLRIEMPVAQRQRGRKLTIGDGGQAMAATNAKPGDEAPTG